jgi:hypothetical protein
MMSKHGFDDATICPVVLNQSNVINNGNNNVLTYNFPGSASFKDAKIAIARIQLFYSWQNINSTYGNNTISIIFPTGATTATVNITIPNGSYSVTDLNSYLQSQMVANNYYLIDGSGNYVYYLEIVENSVRYSIQVNEFPVPTSLPAGWTNPGWTLPTTGYTPQLVIPSTSIQTLLGFTAGTYPAAQQTATYSVLSTSTPQLSPVSSVILGCNLVNNRLANPRSVIYSFSPGGATYGSLIESNAYQYSWIDIQDGTYDSVNITLYDQNFNALQIIDTDIVIFVLVKM